jgi:predicted acyltransferase
MEARPPATLSGRIASLDALRGFDMFWIIGGDAICRALPAVREAPWTRFLARQVEHNLWTGFTFYDLIFPLFLFIIGAVFPFSLLKRVETGKARTRVYLHLVKRTLLLILLGLIAGGVMSFDFAHQRWTGVLQRIGICYFLVALLALNTKIKTQVAVFFSVLLLYWAALALIPVPGYGPGQMTPEGSLHTYIDQQVMAGHISKEFYGPGDSLGVISTLPAACSLLLGVFAGHWLKSSRTARKKILGLLLGGIACLAVGGAWSLAFPIIKHIWTSTYVLWAGGWCLLLLAAFYWLIDVKGWSRWALFFTVIGTNAILVYFGQEVVDFDGISRFFLDGVRNHAGLVAPLIIPVGALAAKWLGLRFLHRHRIFFKV